MTNEEAIRRIQDFMGWFKKNKPLYEALKMAISAMLENEELSKDLDEALKEIDGYERGLSQEPCDECKYKTFTELYFHTDPEMVHVETLHQVMWERDIAIGQLKELGYEFGQKIEPCDDAISRQAVLEMAYDMSEIDGEHFTEPCMVVDVKDIQKLPPVTQKSKIGHWIKKEDDTCWWYACSECEQEPLKNRWNDDDVLSTFCPNCGCRMVEPQESEEQIE